MSTRSAIPSISRESRGGSHGTSPILAIKGRRSAARVLAEARSHTAAALRGDEVVDALLHQAGLLRFRSGDELFNAAEFFERQPLPAGRRIGIVSNSVGVATIAADAAAARGLEVREAGDAPNPLIMPIGAGPDDYGTGVTRLLGEPSIDALMVFYVDVHEGDPDAVLQTISTACAGQPKPAVACVVRSDGRRDRAPPPESPTSCSRNPARTCSPARSSVANGCRGRWARSQDYPDLDGPAARAMVEAFLERNPAGGWISLGEAETLLATHGIPIVASSSLPGSRARGRGRGGDRRTDRPEGGLRGARSRGRHRRGPTWAAR